MVPELNRGHYQDLIQQGFGRYLLLDVMFGVGMIANEIRLRLLAINFQDSFFHTLALRACWAAMLMNPFTGISKHSKGCRLLSLACISFD